MQASALLLVITITLCAHASRATAPDSPPVLIDTWFLPLADESADAFRLRYGEFAGARRLDGSYDRTECVQLPLLHARADGKPVNRIANTYNLVVAAAEQVRLSWHLR